VTVFSGGSFKARERRSAVSGAHGGAPTSAQLAFDTQSEVDSESDIGAGHLGVHILNPFERK
jgi:hypothetical protein